MMGSNSPFMESLASRVLEWHLNHLVQLKRSPTDVAILLRLRKDESIFVSQKVKLLKLYTELFYPPPLSKAPFLHAVAMGFGGEAEFAPFLFKFAVLNSGHVQAEEWLNTLFIKWHYDGRTFEEAFELLKVKEVGPAIFSSRYLTLLGQYRDDSARHTGGQEVRTLCSLLKPEFGGDAKLAVLVYEARHTTEAANVRQGVLFDLFTEWVEKEAKQRDFRSKLFSEMANINEEDSKAIKSAFNIFRKGKRVAD
ncbi:unnamed protein product [Hyaloperonospora brassicae]|uniref:Uncharacterized protein n=1 Tax=Hyaloperonospora brassicae TaxID=162125 RepID=A0AAV0TZM3_HYABA|nr:unnamed protein product [Hyaloperonospora brassicae]